MRLGIFSDYFIKSRIRKALKLRSVYNENRTGVLMLLDSETVSLKNNILAGFAEQGMKTEFFRTIVLSENETNDEVFQLKRKDIRWNAAVKNEQLKELLNTEFDILISFLSEYSLRAELIAAQVSAGLKITSRHDETGIFDLSIISENAEVFTLETLKYLKILKETRA